MPRIWRAQTWTFIARHRRFSVLSPLFALSDGRPTAFQEEKKSLEIFLQRGLRFLHCVLHNDKETATAEKWAARWFLHCVLHNDKETTVNTVVFIRFLKSQGGNRTVKTDKSSCLYCQRISVKLLQCDISIKHGDSIIERTIFVR